MTGKYYYYRDYVRYKNKFNEEEIIFTPIRRLRGLLTIITFSWLFTLCLVYPLSRKYDRG